MWLNLSIWLDGVRKNTKSLGQDNGPPDQVLNPGPYLTETGVLTSRLPSVSLLKPYTVLNVKLNFRSCINSHFTVYFYQHADFHLGELLSTVKRLMVLAGTSQTRGDSRSCETQLNLQYGCQAGSKWPWLNLVIRKVLPCAHVLSVQMSLTLPSIVSQQLQVQPVNGNITSLYPRHLSAIVMRAWACHLISIEWIPHSCDPTQRPTTQTGLSVEVQVAILQVSCSFRTQSLQGSKSTQLQTHTANKTRISEAKKIFILKPCIATRYIRFIAMNPSTPTNNNYGVSTCSR